MAADSARLRLRGSEPAGDIIQTALAAPAQAVDEVLAQAVIEVAGEYHRHRKDLLSMKGVRGAPDWMGHESAVFGLGEQVREIVKANRDLRGGSRVMASVLHLAFDARLGKGRKACVLTVGQYGTPEAQRALVALLDDDEVQAAVINAMRISKQDGHCARIAEIKRSATHGAARHEASKYLKRFCGTA